MAIAFAFVVAMLGSAAGCLRDHPQICGEVICPVDAVCLASRDLCVSAGAAAICDGRPEGAPCTAADVEGSCEGGLCVASVCGDAVVSGVEQCDGDATRSCGDFGFYAGTTTCSAGCFLDTTTCSGRCGDGVVQEAVGELCDGDTPRASCSLVGYDYGHLACTARCTDTSRLDCGRYAAAPLYDAPPGAQIEDVWRDQDLLVVAFGSAGLRVLRDGTEAELAGRFTTIAAGAAGVFASSGARVYRVDQTVEELPAPPVAALTGQSYVAAADAGDLWYLTSACEVASFDGVGWTPRSSPLATTCVSLAVADTGDVYVIASVVGAPRVVRRAGSAWTPVGVTGQPVRLVPGAAGAMLVITTGGVEVIGVAPVQRYAAANVRDAAPSAGGLLTLDSATHLARIDVVPAVQLETLGAEALVRMRRMRDGAIIAWNRRVYELGAITPTLTRSVAVDGIVAGSSAGFVAFKGAQLFDPTGAFQADAGATIRAVAVDGAARIYAATAGGLVVGTWGSLFVPDRQVAPTHVWVTSQGDVGVVDDDGRVLVRAAAQVAWTVRRPADSCIVYALAGPSLDALYIASRCSGTLVIEQTSATARTVVLEVPLAAGSPMPDNRSTATTLPDGSVAFAGVKIVVGKQAAWTVLDAAAATVSGPAVDDLWFGGLRLTPLAPDEVGHWNGSDLVAVRNPLATEPRFVAATAQTVFVASPGELVGLVRLEGE